MTLAHLLACSSRRRSTSSVDETDVAVRVKTANRKIARRASFAVIRRSRIGGTVDAAGVEELTTEIPSQVDDVSTST